MFIIKKRLFLKFWLFGNFFKLFFLFESLLDLFFVREVKESKWLSVIGIEIDYDVDKFFVK